jgi:hypothetical protein
MNYCLNMTVREGRSHNKQWPIHRHKQNRGQDTERIQYKRRKWKERHNLHANKYLHFQQPDNLFI